MNYLYWNLSSLFGGSVIILLLIPELTNEIEIVIFEMTSIILFSFGTVLLIKELIQAIEEKSFKAKT